MRAIEVKLSFKGHDIKFILYSMKLQFVLFISMLYIDLIQQCIVWFVQTKLRIFMNLLIFVNVLHFVKANKILACNARCRNHLLSGFHYQLWSVQFNHVHQTKRCRLSFTFIDSHWILNLANIHQHVVKIKTKINNVTYYYEHLDPTNDKEFGSKTFVHIESEGKIKIIWLQFLYFSIFLKLICLLHYLFIANNIL